MDGEYWPRGPLVLGVAWNFSAELVAAAAGLAAALGVHLVCAFVDPGSYLTELDQDGPREAHPSIRPSATKPPSRRECCGKDLKRSSVRPGGNGLSGYSTAPSRRHLPACPGAPARPFLSSVVPGPVSSQAWNGSLKARYPRSLPASRICRSSSSPAAQATAHPTSYGDGATREGRPAAGRRPDTRVLRPAPSS